MTTKTPCCFSSCCFSDPRGGRRFSISFLIGAGKEDSRFVVDLPFFCPCLLRQSTALLRAHSLSLVCISPSRTHEDDAKKGYGRRNRGPSLTRGMCGKKSFRVESRSTALSYRWDTTFCQCTPTGSVLSYCLRLCLHVGAQAGPSTVSHRFIATGSKASTIGAWLLALDSKCQLGLCQQ